MRHLQRVLALSAEILFSCAVLAQSGPGSLHTGLLLVALKGQSSLAIIDPRTETLVAKIPEGGVTGHEVAATPDGKLAFVPIYGNAAGPDEPGTDGSKIVVMDLASHKVIDDIDFGKGVRPHDPVFGPKNGLLYVTTELNRSITIIDPATLKTIGSVPTGQDQSHMLVISHDGRRGYTANVGPGTVSVLDLVRRKTITVIPIAKQIQRVVLSMDGKELFTADQTKPRLAVIDTVTNKIKTWVPLPDLGYGSAVTPDGDWLIIANPLIHKVSAINLHTFKVEHILDFPVRPQAIVVNPNGRMAYVSCDGSGKVAVVNLLDWKVTKLIDVGPDADGMTWAQ